MPITSLSKRIIPIRTYVQMLLIRCDFSNLFFVNLAYRQTVLDTKNKNIETIKIKIYIYLNLFKYKFENEFDLVNGKHNYVFIYIKYKSFWINKKKTIFSQLIEIVFNKYIFNLVVFKQW